MCCVEFDCTSSNCLPFIVFWILGKRKSHIEPCLQNTGGDIRLECDIWVKLLYILGLVHQYIVLHWPCTRLPCSWLLMANYCGRNVAFIHKNSNVKFGLDFLHGTQYLADWKSNKHCLFLSPVTVFLCSCHLCTSKKIRI